MSHHQTNSQFANRRAQDRERAAAEATAKAKRVEAERRASEGCCHLERASGRQPSPVVLSDNWGRYCSGTAVVDVLLPCLRAMGLG